MKESLRIPLIVNALLSLACGLVLTLAPGTVGGRLDVTIDGWLRLIGIGLIGHTILIAAGLARLEVASVAKLNLAMIGPYPLLMIAVVATGLVERPAGQAIVLIDGAAVGALAAWQWFDLRKTTKAYQPSPV